MPQRLREAHVRRLVRVVRRERQQHLEDAALAAVKGCALARCCCSPGEPAGRAGGRGRGRGVVTHNRVPSGPTSHSCHVRMLSSMSTSSGTHANGSGLFCMAFRSFMRMPRVKESAMVSASRFRLLETGAALGAAAATDITCAGSGSRRWRLLRLGSCNQNLPALVDWEQSFFAGRARRGAARLRASCGCGSRSSLGAAPRVWRSLVEEAHTTLERLLLAVRACPMRPMRRAARLPARRSMPPGRSGADWPGSG